MNFSDFSFPAKLDTSIAAAGYSTPTPIQQQAIPVVRNGQDLIGIAQTGTGKTASFILPIIEKLIARLGPARMPQALIIEPTRELASQVSEHLTILGDGCSIAHTLLVGGGNIKEQTKALDGPSHIVIGTPGRLIDMVERGKLMLAGIKYLVIDEADRMLDMGFIPDVETLLKVIPGKPQTLLFSATMPPAIRTLAIKFMNEPEEITVAPPASTVDKISQWLVKSSRKIDTLLDILHANQDGRALIFCNRKRDVDQLVRDLVKRGLDARRLHGDMDQPSRTRVIKAFKDNEFRFLVCSDVAARGLDIAELPLVVNYQPPTHPDEYIHRIGRTGRAGRSGTAFTLCRGAEMDDVKEIEKTIRLQIPIWQGRIDADALAQTQTTPPARLDETEEELVADSKKVEKKTKEKTSKEKTTPKKTAKKATKKTTNKDATDDDESAPTTVQDHKTRRAARNIQDKTHENNAPEDDTQDDAATRRAARREADRQAFKEGRLESPHRARQDEVPHEDHHDGRDGRDDRWDDRRAEQRPERRDEQRDKRNNKRRTDDHGSSRSSNRRDGENRHPAKEQDKTPFGESRHLPDFLRT
ncbi:MAG: DEAD/DEAH box helicase [Pseudomonadota bacterium]